MTAFLWLKAFHIIFVVTWFAGIFYMPRLLIYHSQTSDSGTRAMFSTMESKLYRIIMRPSMIATLLLGASLLLIRWDGIAGSLWIWIKISLVLILVGYHHYCGALIRQFGSVTSPDQHRVSERFLRIFNEIPALLLILVVLLAVTKPF